MPETLPSILYANALKLLGTERRVAKRIDEAYRILARNRVHGAVEDWLQNPFVSTALGILEKFGTSNYKIKQAIQLLREAGKEAKRGRR